MTIHDLDVCLCLDCQGERAIRDGTLPPFPHHPSCNCIICCNERMDEYKLKKEDLEMRSGKPKTIEISVVRGKGELPGFLPLFQRHFEKSLPAIGSPMGATLTAPLDLLDMMVPDELLSNVESLEIVYLKD